MPTITVREILAEQLGPDWQRSLVEFDAEPAAAASIGQVHRGRWVDGREVAIKVQYPGADKALYSDLKQLSRLAGSLSPILPGIDVSALMKELRDRAVEELDYALEAESQQKFADVYADDPDIVIPNVVRAAPKVIVSEWMDSTGSLLSVIEDGTTEQRDHYGQELVKFLFGSPSRVGMLHADPHPGNFRLIPTDNGHPGKLGVLDFGAVARLPEGNLPRSLGHLDPDRRDGRLRRVGHLPARRWFHQGQGQDRSPETEGLLGPIRRAHRRSMNSTSPASGCAVSSTGSTIPRAMPSR
jgi:predicted unusual protein kinase regulating ubiquinone biosynthesis (AarF/ABC1/UbiB family)